MTDVLLSLTMPEDVAQEVEDLLLSRPDLVAGFTAIQVDGHGSVVRLVRADELVRGHSPRVQIQSVGDEVAMRKVVSLLRSEMPQANIFYWLVPVLELGRL